MKVMVAADRPVVAESIALAVRNGFADVDVQRAGTSSECATVANRWRPELALVDLVTTAAVSLRLQSVLRDAAVKAVFVVVDADEALDRLERGADGVVAVSEGLAVMVNALRTVSDGHTYVPPFMLGDVLRGLIDRRRQQEVARDRVKRLSTREREVFALLGHGRDQGEIARTLSISPETAKTHIRHVMSKLGVRSRIEAAAIASKVIGNGTTSMVPASVGTEREIM